MIKSPAGYTIVELLIVLAVTGVIAVSAFSVIAGKQARTELNQSVRDFDSQLQDVINDVAHGYYPSEGAGARCHLASGNITFDASGGSQGSSTDCIFIGKVIQFEPSGPSGSPALYPPGTMLLHTIVGKRLSGGLSGPSSSSISESKTRAAYKGGGGGGSPVIDLTEVNNILWGMRVESIAAVRPDNTTVSGLGAVGFMTDFGHSGAAPATELYYIYSSAIGQTKAKLVGPGASARLNNYNNYHKADKIEICLERGNRRAKVTLGGDGGNRSKLATDVEFLETALC